MLCAAPLSAGQIFQTLDIIKAYAQWCPATYDINNFDYLNPDYVPSYSYLMPNGWDKLLMTVGLKSRPLWQPKPFLELLEKVTKERNKEGLKGQCIQRIEVSQGDHFLIWASLHGAFHSFVRTLEHLKEQRIIDNDLKIIEPKYYMIFDGNTIDRSPYGMETLTVILRLLEANPTRVFYAQGNHEADGYWEEYDFHDEQTYKLGALQGFMPPYKDGKTPYTAELYNFFDTLPMALFLAANTVERSDGIQIGHYDRSEFPLTFEEQKYILNAVDTKVFPYPISIPKEQKVQKPAKVTSIIEGDSAIVPDYTSDGLRFLPADQGIAAWSVLSSPTIAYQKMYNFYMDSYVEITIEIPIEKTTIKQHYQDVRKLTGFKTGRVYNMFSGQADEQFRAQSKVELVNVGTTTDLKGALVHFGTELYTGLALAFNKQNQDGVIPGCLAELIVLNDGHSPIRSRRNIEALMKDFDTKIMIGLDETMLLNAYLDLVLKKDFLVMFPVNGVEKFRSPQYSNVIHYNHSYINESEISTAYILDKVGANKIAVVYEKPGVGDDALLGVRIACKDRKFTSLIELPFTTSILDFKDQIAAIHRENPDVIALFLSEASVHEFIRQIGVQNIAEKILYGASSIGAESVRQYCQEKGLRLIVTYLVPNPFKSEMPIVQEFRKDASSNNAVISAQGLEAYIIASIFVEGLRIIKGPINNDTIMKSFESMHDYKFKGLTLNFNKNTRELLNTIWIDTGENKDWIPNEVHDRTEAEIDTVRKASDSKKEEPQKHEPEKHTTSWW